jgi:hypothetical protein
MYDKSIHFILNMITNNYPKNIECLPSNTLNPTEIIWLFTLTFES